MSVSYTHTVGPALILIATDPTVAAGAGWTFLGPTDGPTTISPQIAKSYGGNDLLGVTPRAGDTYYNGAAPEVRAVLLDETTSVLKALLGNAQTPAGTGTAFGFKAGLAQMTEPWMLIMPVTQASLGLNATEAIWIPAVDVVDFGQFTRSSPPAGQSNRNPRQTVFRGLYRETVKSGGQTLPDGSRILFIGKPADFGINTIVLPSLTQYLPTV